MKVGCQSQTEFVVLKGVCSYEIYQEIWQCVVLKSKIATVRFLTLKKKGFFSFYEVKSLRKDISQNNKNKNLNK